MKMFSLQILIYLIISIYSVDISSFHVEYFKQNTKLYYVNAMNNIKGNIYFEFWGENDKTRYFIGKNYLTEDDIIFNNNEKIYSIQSSSIDTFHESIIVNDNENTDDKNINILSINWNTFDYINFQNSEFTSKLTKNIAFENNKEKEQSFKNSLIKVNYNNNIYYFSFLIMYKLSAHYFSLTLFELSSNNINGLSTIDSSYLEFRGKLNSTNCFQTETGYIICSFVYDLVDPKDLYVRIYEIKKTGFSKRGIDRFLGRIYINTFLKIFLIKGEIGAYIFIDGDDGNVPKILIKKLNNNKNNIINVINNLNYIIPNNNGKYILDKDLFNSDAIKINDTRFISIFKIKNSFNMLLCIFDFNEDYTGIRVKYYQLNFEEINIHISVNIKCFSFKDYFGIIFYDSISQYPGYMFLNYINIQSENNIDKNNIKINLSESSSLTIFSFSNNISIINNYFGEMKIKVLNLPSPSQTGIIISSSNSNSIISRNSLLNIDDSIIIDTSCSLLGEYFLEFLPAVQEIDTEKEIYGNYNENDLEQIVYFTKYQFNLTFHINSCPTYQYIYIKSPIETYCLSSCDSYKIQILYQDKNENICYSKCSDAINGNIYLYNNKCISNCPLGYKPDENNICIFIQETETNTFNTNYNTNTDSNIKSIDLSSIIKYNLRESTTLENPIEKIEEITIIKMSIKDSSTPETSVIKNNLKGSILPEDKSTENNLLENSEIINILKESTLPEKKVTEKFLTENSIVESNTINNNPKESSIVESSIIENIEKESSIVASSTIENSVKESTLVESSTIEYIEKEKEIKESSFLKNSENEEFFTENNNDFLINKTSIIMQEHEQEIEITMKTLKESQENSFNTNDEDIENSFNINSNSELKMIIESSNKYTDKIIYSSYSNEIENKEDKCNININSLISNYKVQNNILEINYLEICSTTYYCYSSKEDIDTLMEINSKLTYININDCKDILINNDIINEDSDLLIISKKQFKSNSHNFEYELYESNGNKINNISLCNNNKIEMVSSIENIDTFEKAFALYEQGYDIFNLSSSFYYDICLSVNINNSDITLSIRQNDIKPDENSLCSDGCIYNGVNLTTKRISCLCDIDDYSNKTLKSKEEVKENFISYILDMINYKIIKCFLLLFKFQNYYYNYGFYIGGGLFFVIFFLFIIYIFCGINSIKIKYLRNEPKNGDKLLGISGNIYEMVSSSRNLLFQKKRESSYNNKSQSNQNKKIINKKINNQIKQRRKIRYENPPKKKRSINNKKNIDNNMKIEHSKEMNKMNKINIKINVKNNTTLFKNNLKNTEELKINSKDISISKNENEDKNNIDYNELTFKQAIFKDERNLVHIFFSYLNSRIDAIQIIFFPNEFSHFSVTLSLYLFELLLDLTLNALLFSDEVISQKYYNNGELLLITSNILSIASNIISSFIIFITQYLIKYEITLETAIKETKNSNIFLRIFIKIYRFIITKILVFYFIVFIFGMFCSYYLFIFCAIFPKSQKNLFMNYIIGLGWGLGYKVIFSFITTILRKISLAMKNKRLYIIAKFISDKF